ncbi:hypothetical protein [Acinetobacter soli]|uniref:hypothetical protein n=1 Tax=Acinetobacter soli TaxID=487316 RepID=UPI001D18BA6E|nr:hypothetical protein [Acinetobacter soli]
MDNFEDVLNQHKEKARKVYAESDEGNLVRSALREIESNCADYEYYFQMGQQSKQKRIDELTVGCGLQRDHIKGLETEIKKAWTTVDQKGHKNHELVMLLKFIKEHFEMNDLDKAMPRVYEELEQALKGGEV